ncbi:MAG TPA: glutathione S-transferase family protein [Candidatus Polarisedimenticolia bacterium]|nr:glutathione S-transferase family protein [Candidatus Polarisedimenticolia bacterium]
MLRLYYHPVSTFSQRVRIALVEKQIPAELVEVDLFAKAQHRPEYLARNPYGRVPAIEEDGLVLYESTAILEYLEATRPAPPLLPADERQRAIVRMHVRLCDLELAEPARRILVPKRFLPEAMWRLDKMTEARARIQKHFTIVEGQLGGREYLVGSQLSLADVCYAPFLQFVPILEVELGPQTAAWAAGILARPSVQETRPAR